MEGMAKFYKSAGAAQISIIPPTFKQVPRRDGSTREVLEKGGCVFVEVAKGISQDRNNPRWDWDNKITFALSFSDICKLLENEEGFPRGGNEASARIFHKFGNENKTFQLLPGQGKYEGKSWQLKVSSGKNFIMVPLSSGEHIAFMKLLVAKQPYLVGF